MAAVLWGTDYEELGEVGTVAVDDRTALAITRGLHKKAYRFEDPNEDAVAAVRGPAGTLIVCADGHNGSTAPVVATQFVLDHFGANPPPELEERAWLELFAGVNDAVIAAKGIGTPHPASNTVLLVALVTTEHVSWASLGDAALVIARPGAQRGRQLNKEAMRFVGQPMTRRSAKKEVQRGGALIEPGEWLVAITDGLSEFVSPLRPADVVPRVLATLDPATAENAARTLINTACSAGAGDNVAAAVMGPAR